LRRATTTTTTRATSQKKIEFKMSLTEKSNNNDNMTTTSTTTVTATATATAIVGYRAADPPRAEIAIATATATATVTTQQLNMPDDLCRAINGYLKPSWKRFSVETEYWSRGLCGHLPSTYKYFVEADYDKAQEYWEEKAEEALEEGSIAIITLQYQEYTNGEWKFNNKYKEQYEDINSCSCCNKSVKIGRHYEEKEGFTCYVCDTIFCRDCEDNENWGMSGSDWYCGDCYGDLTDEEEED
jgi:hypothetical protein